MPRRCQNMKEIVAPEMAPKSFGTFVKYAPGHKWNTSILLCELIELFITRLSILTKQGQFV